MRPYTQFTRRARMGRPPLEPLVARTAARVGPRTGRTPLVPHRRPRRTALHTADYMFIPPHTWST